MKIRVVVISAVCLSIIITPASSTNLLAAAAAVKGAIIGAGLAALKSGGVSETVIVQSQPGSMAEVVPSNQIIIDLNKPGNVHNAQTITYTSSNPISRLWTAVSNIIAAKAKFVGDLIRPNPVVVVVPQTTEEVITEKPMISIDLGHKPLPSVDVELCNKPLQLPSIDIDVSNKPLQLPSVDIELSNKPLHLPSIQVVNHKPSVELSASIGRDYVLRKIPHLAVLNYIKK